MRARILSFVFVFMMISGFAQKDELKLQRDSLYQEYVNFKDTMSSRTWINMVDLSNKLETVVLFDNMMLDSIAIVSPGESVLQARVLELSKLRDELIADNARVNTALSQTEKYKNTLLIIAIILGLLLVGVVIGFIFIINKHKKLSSDSDNYMEGILKLKEAHKKETDLLKDQIEEYAGEMELLENNALSIKKAYDILKSEQAMQSEIPPSNNSNEIADIRKEVEELSDEMAKLIAERDEFEEALGMANLKLAHQIDLNKKFEADLESLLGRVKGKAKNDQD
jgi:flagellar basal body-associated protein FliL